MSPALNESSTLERFERFERCNASEIHNRIVFDFYLGLPHVYMLSLFHVFTDLHVYEQIGIHLQGYTGCPSDMTENILLGLSPHYAVQPDVVCASQSSLGYTVDRTCVSTTNLLHVKTACVSCLWKPAVSCCSCRLAPAIMSNLEESSTHRVVNWKTNFRFKSKITMKSHIMIF